MNPVSISVAGIRVINISVRTILNGDLESLRYFTRWIETLLPGKSPLNAKTPWINFKAIAWLDKHLNKGMTVFEYGSGGSTLFFSERVKKVISIEHNSEWHDKVLKALEKGKIKNCECKLIKPEEIKSHSSEKYISKIDTGRSFKKYVKSIDKYENKSLDMVFIDGRARALCIAHSVKKIKKGGYLVLDNSQRKEYGGTIKKYLGRYKSIIFKGILPFVSTNLGTTCVWEMR